MLNMKYVSTSCKMKQWNEYFSNKCLILLLLKAKYVLSESLSIMSCLHCSSGCSRVFLVYFYQKYRNLIFGSLKA